MFYSSDSWYCYYLLYVQILLFCCLLNFVAFCSVFVIQHVMWWSLTLSPFPFCSLFVIQHIMWWSLTLSPFSNRPPAFSPKLLPIEQDGQRNVVVSVFFWPYINLMDFLAIIEVTVATWQNYTFPQIIQLISVKAKCLRFLLVPSSSHSARLRAARLPRHRLRQLQLRLWTDRYQGRALGTCLKSDGV